MDRRVGCYLHEPSGVVEKTKEKQSLCIIETRESYFLPLVIQNALSEFPEWDLYVAAPDFVLRWLLGMFPGIKPIVLEDYDRSVDTFNKVMFSPQFWDALQTEYVMMFQCDAVFAKGAARNLPTTGKDFYGPACGTITETEFVINGGLSYRRVAAFRKACTQLTIDDKKLPEDVAYTRLMRKSPGFQPASLRECLRFAIESYGNPFSTVGVHGTDKGYAPPGLIAATLGLKPARKVYDCVSFDGEPILKTRLAMLYKVVDVFVIVEARVTHAGQPKDLAFDPAEYAPWMDKIRYVVIDEVPEMPADAALWTAENRESWWREKYQRDVALDHVDDDDGLIVCGDVDEIPDPAALADLPDVDEPVHLDMAFLVHQPWWKKNEPWARAFVCSAKHAKAAGSLTEIRTATSGRILPNAGWHCSSFFDVASQIRKVQHFAHREFSSEIDPVVVRQRLETGKDPYGRGPQYDCEKTMEYIWLKYFVV